MQERPTTVAAYAAGASLAAVALFYVFGPNYTLDADEASDNNRKKSIVGLSNQANDCFINSVLQALAGLGDLRVYLIRELHRRELDGPEIYNTLPSLDEIPRGEKPAKVRELQQGTITRALKEMLDRLNERPIYKKTISARGFIQALEFAYRTRISRNQQDAQEFLQIVAERLCDEYHAGVKARQRGLGSNEVSSGSDAESKANVDVSRPPAEVEVRIDDGSENGLPAIIDTKLKEIDNEHGFPFEGKLESQIECQFCHYKYKPNQTSFVNLTLQVPQKSSTSLSSCFDGLLKTEYIDDFKCDKCRLQHALQVKTDEKIRSWSEKQKERLDLEIEQIKTAIDTDPEMPLDSITLPPPNSTPKRRIARYMRITVFPKIIAIHLSRSIFDRSSSTKNAAKVSFPERLALGGILSQKWFKLLAIVCHKGSHNSGHYESFRRNHIYPPFATPDVFSSYAQSRATSLNPSRAQSPHRSARNTPDLDARGMSSSASTSSPSLSGASTSTKDSPRGRTHLNPPSTPPTGPATSNSRVSFQSNRSRSSASKHTLPPDTETNGTGADSTRKSGSSFSMSKVSLETPASKLRRRRKTNDRWWRISDEKIKECKTSDVLGMQKEVYLMFYEMEKPTFGPQAAGSR